MQKETGKKLRDHVSFCIAALCFGLWGVAGVMMRPASHALGRILGMTGVETGDSAAFHSMYVSFLLMSLPACLAVRRYGFKTMVVIGLTLFSAGTLTFAPAAEIGRFNPFLLGYTLMSVGLIVLEAAAIPYVLTFGVRRRSMLRIMVAQSINAIGWLAGYYIIDDALIHGPSGPDVAAASLLDNISGSVAQSESLWSIATPYMLVGAVAISMAVMIGSTSFFDRPQDEAPKDMGVLRIIGKLVHDKVFMFGTLSQFCYMTAQTLCWSGILSYGTSMLMGSGTGMSRSEAESTAVTFVTAGVAAFAVLRVAGAVAAACGKYKPSMILTISAALATTLCAASLLSGEYAGLVCMVGVSACMSIMRPTIYYLSMRRQNISGIQIGTAAHLLCIFGGLTARKLMPASDGESVVASIAMLLFVAIGVYGWWCQRHKVGV